MLSSWVTCGVLFETLQNCATHRARELGNLSTNFLSLVEDFFQGNYLPVLPAHQRSRSSMVRDHRKMLIL